MSRDKATRTLFKGGVILFLGIIIDLGISFLAKLLIARYLGRVDYGAVSLGVSLLSFGSTILLLGLDTGIGRYLPRYEQSWKRRAVIELGILLTLPPTIGISILLIVFQEQFARTLLRAPGASGVLAVFAVGLPFAVLFKYSLGVIQGEQWSIPKALLQNILKPIVRFGAIAIGVFLGVGAVEMSITYILPFVVATAASFYWLRRTELFGDIGRPRSGSDYILISRELVSFSIPMIVTTVMFKILTDIDRFLLSYYKSTGDVGVYSIVYPLAQLLTVGLSAFAFISMPILSELHAKEKTSEMKRMYQVSARWIFFMTLPIAGALIFFPRYIIKYTFGPEYVDGASALAILALGFFAHSLVGLNGSSLTSIGRTKSLAAINILVVFVNVGLNILLIPEFTYLGAAIATSISYIGMNLFYSGVLYYRTGIHPFGPGFLRSGMISTVALVLVCAHLRWAVQFTWVWVVIHGIAFSIVYILAIFRFGGIRQEELLIINSVEERTGISLAPLKRLGRRLLPE